MARTKKPRSRSAREASSARASSPSTTGKIGAATRATSKPEPREAGLHPGGEREHARAPLRLGRTIASAASAAPEAAGGGRRREDERARARDEEIDEPPLARDERPDAPSAFPSVPMCTSTRSADAERLGEAAAASARARPSECASST